MSERTRPPPRLVHEAGPIRLHLWPGEGPATLIIFGPGRMQPPAPDRWWGHGLARWLGWRTLSLSSAAQDGYPADAMAEVLPLILAHAGPLRVTYGFSMGGYGALKYGAALGARVSLALSPRASIDPADIAQERRGQHVLDTRRHAGMAVAAADLAALPIAVFDPIAPVDGAHGRFLAAMPGMVAVPMRHAGHGTPAVIVESRCLPEVLEHALAGDAAAAAAALRRARRASPSMLSAIASALESRGRARWAASFAAAADALRAPGRPERALEARARALHATGRFQEEAAVLREWLALEPAVLEPRLRLAHCFLAMDATEEAVGAIREAIAAGPVDQRLRAELVAALRRLNRANQAIVAAREAVAAAPGRASAHLLLGETLLWARRLPAARQAFERALRLDPGQQAARFGLAASEEAPEEPGPALRDVVARLAEGPAPERDWAALLDLLSQARRPGAVEFVAAAAVAAWPQSLTLRERLGGLRLAAGDAVAAERDYRILAEAQPDRAEGWLGLTDALWRQKRFAEGVQVLRRAVALHPRHAVLAVRMASFLLAMGDVDAGVEEARRAVALDPGLEIAHLTLADALFRTRQTGRMIRALEAALEALPASAAIAARLGHVQAGLEMPARAAEAFARAVAAPRPPVHAFTGLIDALLQLDRRSEAEAAARRGLAAYPASKELQARLGQIVLDGGDAGAARDALAEALASEPGSEAVHLAMADALLRQGRLAEAIAAAREAVAVSGGKPSVAARLGHLLIEAGEVEEAAVLFTRVTEEAPDLVTGWVGLSDAERLRKRIREAVAACRRAEAAGADRHTLRMLRYRLYGEMEE